jgi:hypothetical protein
VLLQGNDEDLHNGVQSEAVVHRRG